MEVLGILFDLDNTMADRYKSLLKVSKVFKEHFKGFLKNIEIEELQKVIVEADCNGYIPKEEVFNDIIGRPIWIKKPSISQISEFWDAEFGKCTEAVDGLYEVLNYFFDRGIKIGIVTNGSVHRQNLKIDVLGIRKYMKTIIISDEIGLQKPDPRIFNVALKKLGLNAENVVFVGDNPELDIVGARGVGIKPVWVSWGNESKKGNIQNELMIKGLKEILKLSEDKFLNKF